MPKGIPGVRVHGKYSTYHFGCRCSLCRKAMQKHKREYYHRNPMSWRNYELKKKYGIEHDDYEMLIRVQNGLCAICGKRPSVRRLHVDHCHKTGFVRGLLCPHCNGNLGWLEKLAHEIRDYIGATAWESLLQQ